MEFVILTGLSGAGKGRTKSILADFGYYCIDNLPLELLGLMVELAQVRHDRFERVALVVDARSNERFDAVFEALEHMRALNFDVKVLFLEADNTYILRRYKETRRRHPLDDQYPEMDAAINAERQLLTPLRQVATNVVNTTNLSSNQLRDVLVPLFGDASTRMQMVTEIRTFGFKHGLPMEADLVFDVRFLPNPFYVTELRPLTGKDAPVHDFVMDFPQCGQFLRKLCDMLAFLMPQFQAEGRQKLVIAIGCTGGKHRSVTIAEEVGHFLTRENYAYTMLHRDIDK